MMKVKSFLTETDIEDVNKIVNGLAEHTIRETLNPKRTMDAIAAIRYIIWEPEMERGDMPRIVQRDSK